MVGPGKFLGTLVKIVSRVSVQGQANLEILDRPGPAIIVVNHTTVVDVIVVVGTLHNMGFTADGPCEGVCPHRRHIRPMGTSDLWNFPVSKQVCEGSGIIPVDQFDGRGAYKAARDALKRGEVILIYPEGDVKINEQGAPRSWRPGASGLAKAGSAVVIPIAHHDSRNLGSGSVRRSIVMGLTSFLRRPVIQLRIGKPVDSDQLKPLSVSQANDLLEQTLFDTWQLTSAETTSR